MKRPYIVVLGEGFPRQDILNWMEQDRHFGYWFYSMPNSFIIYSSVDANAIDSFIKEKTGGKYRYFISEVSPSNIQGWMPKEHWFVINNNGIDKVYELIFNGFYRNTTDLPHASGIYCVYRGSYVQSSNSVTIHELLYIGRATDICQRHVSHENRSEWQRLLNAGEELWYTYALLDSSELERCEAALIYLNKPRCNIEGRGGFRHLDTVVNATGVVNLLNTGLAEKDV